MPKKPLNAVDELKVAASSLLLATVQTIHESDKTFRERLIKRIEANLETATAAGLVHVSETLALALKSLRDSKNFPS